MAAIRSRLSYANVMATIAVFGVLAGGGAYAASKIGPKQLKVNAVRSKHVKNQTLLRKDFKAGVLPTVEATKTVTSFLSGWETYDSGTPATSDDAPVRYWKDLSGTVHLEGAVTNAGGPFLGTSSMFRLPEGYRPAANYLSFAVVTTGFSDFDEVLGYVQIVGADDNLTYPIGTVNFEGGNEEYVSLNGISFRAQ
jgi:hypothetical protein